MEGSLSTTLLTIVGLPVGYALGWDGGAEGLQEKVC